MFSCLLNFPVFCFSIWFIPVFFSVLEIVSLFLKLNFSINNYQKLKKKIKFEKSGK